MRRRLWTIFSKNGRWSWLLFSVASVRTINCKRYFGITNKFIGGDAWYNVTVRNNTQHFEDGDYIASRLGAGINFRAKNIQSFDNLEKNAIDFYASVKSLYLQDRQQKILNSNEIIEAMDDSDWDDIENQ